MMSGELIDLEFILEISRLGSKSADVAREVSLHVATMCSVRARQNERWRAGTGGGRTVYGIVLKGRWMVGGLVGALGGMLVDRDAGMIWE